MLAPGSSRGRGTWTLIIVRGWQHPKSKPGRWSRFPCPRYHDRYDGRNPVKPQPEPSGYAQVAGVGRLNLRGRKTMTTITIPNHRRTRTMTGAPSSRTGVRGCLDAGGCLRNPGHCWRWSPRTEVWNRQTPAGATKQTRWAFALLFLAALCPAALPGREHSVAYGSRGRRSRPLTRNNIMATRRAIPTQGYPGRQPILNTNGGDVGVVQTDARKADLSHTA